MRSRERRIWSEICLVIRNASVADSEKRGQFTRGGESLERENTLKRPDRSSGRCFGYVRDWVEKKLRRHLMRARKRKGFGWKRWTRSWLSTRRSDRMAFY
ncbi:MAG: hypothetical protein ACMUIL_12620 [bacterium]